MGPGARAQKSREKLERGPDRRRRIEPGREGGGDSNEPILAVERAIDGPPVAMDDVQRGAMKAPEDPIPPRPPVRPNGKPARIVDERVGEDDGSGVVLARLEGASFHGGDLL